MLCNMFYIFYYGLQTKLCGIFDVSVLSTNLSLKLFVFSKCYFDFTTTLFLSKTVVIKDKRILNLCLKGKLLSCKWMNSVIISLKI